MDLEIRPVIEDEFSDWLRAESLAWSGRFREADTPSQRPLYDLKRSLAAFDGSQIVGTAHSLPHQMAVPGNALAVAAVDDVAVVPTHRRRGILTRMMERQLRDAHESGEPLAALTASESVIYGRFGYGIGTLQEHWRIERQHNAFARTHESTGTLTLVEPSEMTKIFPDVYERATDGRPGVIQRPGPKWDRIAADPEPEREGRGPYFHVGYENGGGWDGYVSYGIEGAKLTVRELMATTDEANAALWRFCLDMDRRTTTEAIRRPVDDPLPWMLADPRRLERSPRDGIWVRLVDVAAALAGRRYDRADRLVIQVSDTFCDWNDGSYLVDGGPDEAECRPTTATPDLVLSAADLAATYLGTVRFTTLSQAGRVEERTPGALPRADAMFAAYPQPWCPYEF